MLCLVAAGFGNVGFGDGKVLFADVTAEFGDVWCFGKAAAKEWPSKM